MEKNKNMPFVRIALALALFICSAAIALVLKSRYDMGPSPFDLSVQQWFFSLRGDGLNAIVSALTHCGDTVTIIALCILLLLLPNRLKFGVPVSISALGGVAIYKPMKHIFMRARPDEVFHLVEQGGYSFPSGHSVTSVVVYGLLIYLIRKRCKNQTVKNILTVLCAALMIIIGPSRIYVGVHWPTDVLCGWLIGSAVLIIAVTILERMNKKNEDLQ